MRASTGYAEPNVLMASLPGISTASQKLWQILQRRNELSYLQTYPPWKIITQTYCFKHLAVLWIWLNWKYCGFPSLQIQEVCLLSGKFNLNRNYAILPHLTLQCIHCRSVFQGLLPSLQSSPKNVIYTESWHLDDLQSPHMGMGVSSSHQAKNHPLFTVSRLGLVGDGFFTITSIHEGRALGSTLNSSSLSYRKQRNSCHTFPVMLLVFKCCSPAGVGDGGGQGTLRTHFQEGSDLFSWFLGH